MQPPTPATEHHWLKRFLGDWNYESEEVPGMPWPYQKMEGRETFRPLGDIWVLGEMHNAGMGSSLTTIGFEPRTGRFTGSWIGSMMTHHWVYDGTRDGDRLALAAVGPSFAGDGSMANYVDEHEFVSDDERVLRARVQNADGSWMHFMTTRYRRA